MSRVRPFVPEDLPELNRWLRALGFGEYQSAELLPATGLIKPGGAAGFLYLTDAPGLAFVSGLTPCPEASIQSRIFAMRGVVKQLMALAASKGVRQIVTWTPNEHIAQLAVKLSFLPVERALIMAAFVAPPRE
jgi:hypothetical protein